MNDDEARLIDYAEQVQKLCDLTRSLTPGVPWGVRQAFNAQLVIVESLTTVILLPVIPAVIPFPEGGVH